MKSLPISIDVIVNVSQAQAAIAYDMTLACIVIPGATPVAAEDRIKYFMTYDAALETTEAGSSLDYALRAFFSQSPRPNGVAIGQVDPANDLIDEVALIAAASLVNAKPVYGWILDKSFRDTSSQKDFADWVSARPFAVAALVTNDVKAYNAADETNIAFHALNTGNKRVAVIYHNDATYYPDASILAYMLAVDYAAEDSTVTAKFKDLPGVTTTPLDATQLAALEARRCNVFSLVGNGNRTFREGVTSAVGWHLDTLINLDNFANELQTAAFNVFLQNAKVPYTTAGQMMLVGAASDVCKRYSTNPGNGTFAPREKSKGSGTITVPAYVINPSPVSGATASDRAARTIPPISITAYEAGAGHEVSINVNAIQ